MAGKALIFGIVLDTISGSLEYHHDRQDLRAKKKMESLAFLKHGFRSENSKSNPKIFETSTFFRNKKNTQSKSYKIGDRGPAGGWIFYDKGEYSDGWRYLEAAPEDQDKAKWGCYEKLIPGTEGTDIGDGKNNTQAIIKNCSEANIAAKKCIEYRGGGKSDWFLPSLLELVLMYEQLFKKGVGGFTDFYYWSSSEFKVDLAWIQYFQIDIHGGGHDGFHKNISLSVRAVRAF